MIYFVTRHAGALEWLKSQIQAPAIHLDHIDEIADIKHGDVVIGTLPVHMAANVCSQGARYFHITLDLPREWRGKDLTAQQLEQLGTTLTEYMVTPVNHENTHSAKTLQKGGRQK